MGKPVLEVNNLKISFNINDDFYPAINGVSMNFYEGKMHAIVGESGCGKTITAMSILNLLPKNSKVDCGEIIFDDEDLLKFNDKKMQNIRGKKISFIPQDPMTSLNPLYTIQNQLLEIIMLHNNLNKIDANKLAVKTLEDVGIRNIETVLKSYPCELSGGMKQRIIISMALAINSEIIIADEPTTALDVTIQAQILKLLDDIKKRGKTIILITHNLAIVSKYCDDVSVMYLGEIIESAPTKELFKNPKHPYTKALIEALPSDKNVKLKNLKGQPSPITERICGCRFHPRCDKCFEKCVELPPSDTTLQDKHSVKCWHYK